MALLIGQWPFALPLPEGIWVPFVSEQVFGPQGWPYIRAYGLTNGLNGGEGFTRSVVGG